MKWKRVIFFQLAYWMLFFGACATFQKDPVGASLYSMKSVYEGQVRTVGQAYLDGRITREQLVSFVEAAKQFHQDYTIIVNLYEAKTLPEPEQRVAMLRKSLDALQTALQNLLLKQSTSLSL